ncbi:hypothetical protein [Enterovibrio sp. 27052020O]|uniref:hypothetical protein n=1 Tax=Enterovibrio sp. 27052020O TaxID=3241166 RepID=UPI00388E7872
MTELTTQEKAVGLARFSSLLIGGLSLSLSSLFYFASSKSLPLNIAFGLYIGLLIASFLTDRQLRTSNPLKFWAKSIAKTGGCFFISMSLIPLYFTTDSLNTPYLILSSVSLISGISAYFFGWHYFSEDVLSANMKKNGMLQQGFLESHQDVSAGIFHAFKQPENGIVVMLAKLFKSLLVALALLAVIFGAGLGFIILSITTQLLPDSITISPHALVIFVVILPMTTAFMVYIKPIQEFIKI